MYMLSSYIVYSPTATSASRTYPNDVQAACAILQSSMRTNSTQDDDFVVWPALSRAVAFFFFDDERLSLLICNGGAGQLLFMISEKGTKMWPDSSSNCTNES